MTKIIVEKLQVKRCEEGVSSAYSAAIFSATMIVENHTCKWSDELNDFEYITQCQELYMFDEKSAKAPKEEGFIFCPNCQGRIVIIEDNDNG